MRRSTTIVVIPLVVVAATLLGAGAAAGAPLPVVPDPGGTAPSTAATFDPSAGSAAVEIVGGPTVTAAAGAHESAVRASVRRGLQQVPGLDPGHLAQILKNLDQGTLF